MSSRAVFGFLAAAGLLAAGAVAQQDARPLLKPITTPIQHAGVFHVGTGTWTPGGSLANLTGPDVIYKNTCSEVYFVSQTDVGPQGIIPGAWTHRSAVPSPSHPTVPSAFYPSGDDEAPGCQTRYTVNGFQFAYCSSATHAVEYQLAFANSYMGCASVSMVPDHTFDITGLPGGTASGALRCWTVDVDLDAGGQSFLLQADGDGTYTGPSTQNQFGVWWKVEGMIDHSSDHTGPLIAGNFTWTGGPYTGPLSPCRGTDGTIWDSPVNLAEEGTGMTSNDSYRVECFGVGCANCTNFGGKVHADFHLVLYSDAGCGSSSPMSSYCSPGEGGVIPCPCSNAPSSLGRGCDNFGAHSGGARLSQNGIASLARDTVVFTASDENASALTIFLQGTASVPAGAPFGAGLRCVGGTLKRLYTEGASGGTSSEPDGGDATVSARSAALGDLIQSGQHRYYMAYYRDPSAAGPCGDPAKTFNSTQSGDILWGP